MQVRPLTARDVDAAGDILYQAFTSVYDRHGFRAPFPSPEAGAWLSRAYVELDAQGGWLALQGHEPVGVGFLHARGQAASIGPVAARPGAPAGTGKAVMETLLRQAEKAGARSIRLFQDAFNAHSFALYAKLGFSAREVVAYAVADAIEPPRLDSESLRATPPLGSIRELERADLSAIAKLDAQLFATDRRIDFELLLQGGSGYGLFSGAKPEAFLFVREGAHRVALAPGGAHQVADLLALVAHGLSVFAGRTASVRVPQNPPEVFRALLDWGFRIDHLGNLMVRGPYETRGPCLYAMFPESL